MVSPLSADVDATATMHQGTPFHHFAACLSANVRLRLRAPVRTIVETVIVPVFALALVIGWVLAGRADVDSLSFFGAPTTPPSPAAYPEHDLLRAVCRNETFGTAHRIPPHTRLSQSLIPRVCSNSSKSSADTECFVNTALGDLCVERGQWRAFLRNFSNFKQRRTVPDFDTMAVARVVAHAAVADSDRGMRTPLASLANGPIMHLVDGPGADALAAYLRANTTTFEFLEGVRFADDRAMRGYTRNESHFMTTWCVVEPLEFSIAAQKYTLHCNQSGLPEGNLEEPEAAGAGLAAHASKLYLASGFLTLQNAINEFYTTDVLGLPAPSQQRTLDYSPMPVPGGVNEQFLKVAGSILVPLILGFAYMFTVSQCTRRVAEEKESRLREAMLTMGLSAPSVLLAWLTSEAIIQTASALILAITFVTSMADDSNFFVLLGLFWLNAMTVVTLAGFLGAFFSRARVAAMASPVLFFMTVIPAISVSADVPAGAIYGMSWSPAMTLKYGVSLIFRYEANGGGFHPADMRNPRDRVTMANLFISMAAVAAGFVILMLYVDAVVPRPFGRRRSVFFPITAPILWLVGLCRSGDAGAVGDETDGRDPDGVFEPETDGVDPRRGVLLRGLRRSFVDSRGKKFEALGGLSLYARPGEVTALLGPNGAGKSTTYSILTGGIRRSAGRASVFGSDVDTQLGQVRSMLAYCPQHNVLWPHLTCREHLRFVGRSRGFPSGEIEARAEAMAADVALTSKLDSEAGGLSGGQKRKLSIAMAFMADAPVVLLDEPTAGCDVAARHSIWGAIRKQAAAAGRVIMLSTHFLEEAEELSQHIAILCRGRLKASGSPTFLKSRLGVGYDLAVTAASSDRAVVGAVEAIVRRHLPDAPIDTAAGEIKVAVGRDAVATALPHLLADLEAQQPALVRDVGVGATTLESIFMSIVEADALAAEAERAAVENAGQPPIPANSIVVLNGEEFNDGAAAANPDGGDALSDPLVQGDVERGMLHVPTRPSTSASSPSAASNPLDEIEMSERVARGDAETANHQQPAPPASSANHHADEEEEDGPLWHDDEVGRGGNLLWQFLSLLNKRFIYARRDTRTVCLQTLVPVIATVLAMLFGLITIEEQELVILSPSGALRTLPIEMPVATAAASPACVDAASLATRFGPDVTGLVVPVDAGDNAAATVNLLLAESFKNHSLDRVTAAACDASATTIFSNESFYHGAPIAVQAYQKAVARVRLGSNGTTPEYVIGSHPLKYTPMEKALHATIFAVVIAIMITIPFSLIPSTYVSFVVREREEGSKQLQLVSGVSVPLYWLSHFVFDLLSFAVTGVLIFCVFLMFSRQEYIGNTENFEATLTLIAVFGLSAILGAYAVSFAFNSHATAQNTTLMGYFIVGFLVTALVFQLDSVSESARGIAKILRFVFRVVPVFALADGMLGLASLERVRVITGGTASPWQMDVIGWDLVYMAVELPIFALVVFLCERPSAADALGLYDPKPAPASTIPDDEDEDVAAERARIERHYEGAGEGQHQDMVVIRGLRKEYDGGRVVAVNNLSLGIERGSVFGFLGSNGAGKTTTLNVLSANEGSAPTNGHVTVDGHDPVTDPRAVHAAIGVCPQFDTVFSLLTPVENLKLVASLRGVPLVKRAAVVDRIVKAVGLESHRDKVTATLSGGNRRKLSVAAALVGGPALVVLDEPTAGIDTVARRALWGVIARASRQATIVLTTHHLAEVEHLASRAGIMVGGQLKCLGSLQRLKSRYGDGLTLHVRVGGDNADVDAVVDYISSLAPGADVRGERRGRTVTMLLPPMSVRLSTLFLQLEDAARRGLHGLADYTVAQASVEDVFLKVVSGGNEPTA